ncbi:hypothetical protein [Flexivirga oryzae]|uniref:Uncharacterized protein n=1 Tax=Flexivirga oryzae TaxID=1794944 RepID=A0A839NJ36_9MICO|nr:hypothetical protein [Flexivirga oryzae]MBB2894382.1 hypothetical protein [Flexivirga oryzae]
MAVRRLGDGYEPHVDEEDGELTYSVPVDAGITSASFSFRITQSDLEVLRTDAYRRAALEVIGHAVLQRSMDPERAPVSQEQFSGLVATLLHGAPGELEAAIDRAGVEHHMVTRLYIDQVLQRRE